MNKYETHKEEVIKLRKQGVYYSQIGKKLNISAAYAFRIFNEDKNKKYQNNLKLYRKGNEKFLENKKKRYKENVHVREKAKARSAVSYWKKKGKVKPKPCIYCDSITDIQAHHEDYSKPLDILWLCRNCHYKHHNDII